MMRVRGLPENPFVGLRPFKSHESLLFFGREKQAIATMLDETIIPYGTRGVKLALSILGYEGDRCRKPLLPVDDEGKGKIAGALKEAGLLSW